LLRFITVSLGDFWTLTGESASLIKLYCSFTARMVKLFVSASLTASYTSSMTFGDTFTDFTVSGSLSFFAGELFVEPT
jgi:hypothetical protein